MTESQPDIEWVKALAYEAGKVVCANYYEREKETKFKISSADLLTKTDVAVEQMLIGKIKQKYPSHFFLCEESAGHSQELTDEPTWVIDPIDGTTNFVHMFPFVGVSIGFCVHKKILLGVIYIPIWDELFYATRNGGAFLISGRNKSPEKITVAPHRNLEHSVIATGMNMSRIRKLIEEDEKKKLSSQEIKNLEEIKEISFYNIESLMMNCRDIRRLGACVCEAAYVACGRLDGMCELGVKEWDICAGILLVVEAGGTVINYDKTQPVDLSKRQLICASNIDLAMDLNRIQKYPSFDQRSLE